MKDILICVICLCVVSLLLVAQPLSAQIHFPDEWWPIGKVDTIGDPDYGTAWLHFVGDTFEVVPTNLGVSMEAAVAVASDTLGQVLFYSNGCEIRNASGNIIPEGEGLNPGALHDISCQSGYIMSRSMVAIPKPGNPSEWYVLHIGGRYEPIRKLIYEKLYYSKVTIASPTEQGQVSEKNTPLLEGDMEPFALTKHGNGRDWWVICPEYNTNRYHKWLLSPLGVHYNGNQEIGEAIGCKKVGASVFSQDGTFYARTNNCLAVVLQFNRCTGNFSEPIPLPRGEVDFPNGGLTFSKDNKWLYATSNLCIFKADLTADTPFLDSLYKRPYLEGESLYVYGTSLMYMQETPSGKIFMNARHQEKYFSTLDILGDTSLMTPEGAKLPINSIRTLPYFPNFRLYDLQGSLCDTLGINTPISVQDNLYEQEGYISCYPNPFEESITIDLPEQCNIARVEIMNALGQLVYIAEIKTVKNVLNLGNLPNGLYYCVVKTTEAHSSLIVKKLIKMK